MRYDSVNPSCGYESKLYKFSAFVGDSTGTSCVFGENFKCIRIFDTTLFGISINSKKFYYGSSTGNSQTIKYSIFGRNVGAYYVYSSTATVHSVQKHIHYLIGANINGIIYGDTSFPTGINKISSQIPESFSLSQNYPNPFNPTTKIKFSLPAPSKGGVQEIKLIVYNILGKEVASLIPPLWGGKEGLSPGTYEVEWDGTNYPSGVYYYALVTGDPWFALRMSKKMVLIK